MHRYRPTAPSRATAATLCQKCLKRGHYTYECTASSQDRPYISRPSRTQQLLNPKLVPKLSATSENSQPPPTDPKPESRADARSGAGSRKVSADYGRSPIRVNDLRSRRGRSVSSSAGSVSTISTNRSRSRSWSPPLASKTRPRDRSVSQSRRDEYRRRRGSRESDTIGREQRRSSHFREKAPALNYPSRRDSTPPYSRKRSLTPERRGHRGVTNTRGGSRSRSPYRGTGRERPDPSDAPKARSDEARERSLSPYSRRAALSRVA